MRSGMGIGPLDRIECTFNRRVLIGRTGARSSIERLRTSLRFFAAIVVRPNRESVGS